MKVSKSGTIGLAVVATMLMVAGGCSGDSVSELTAPELDVSNAAVTADHHNPNHGGGNGGGNDGGGNDGGGNDGGSASTVTVSDGMVAANQPVDVKENRTTLTVSDADANQIPVELAILDTQTAYLANLGACTVDQPDAFTEAKKAELLGYLVDAVQKRHWRMEVDKAALGSASTGNKIATNFTDDETGVLLTVMVGSPDLMPSSSVVVEGPTDTFTLTGGAVLVADRSGTGTKGTLKIACPNEDTFIVELQR